MKLMAYIRPNGKPEGIEQSLATQVGSIPAYILQVAKYQLNPSDKGGRRPGPDLAKAIELATGGKVRREALIWPDDYE